MRRREFITIIGVAVLGGTAALWRSLTSFWQPRFNEHTAATVKVITGLMFPGDGLPGAAELKIHTEAAARFSAKLAISAAVRCSSACRSAAAG